LPSYQSHKRDRPQAQPSLTAESTPCADASHTVPLPAHPKHRTMKVPVPLTASGRTRRSLFVIGMHRSGTSAVTRLIGLLGIPLNCQKTGSRRARPTTRAGSGGTESHLRVNDEILGTFDGTWNEPPPLRAAGRPTTASAS
jgi:hypothetical protein